MKFSTIALIGISIFTCASCSQDVEIVEESQGQLKELSFENVGLKFMEPAVSGNESNTRRRVHSTRNDGRFQYYDWDVNDPLAIISPECPEGNNKGVYLVQSFNYATIGLTKQQGSIKYNVDKENDIHRIVAGYPAGKVEMTSFAGFNAEYVEGDFKATIDGTQSATISESADENGYYTIADWKNAIFAGFWADTPYNLMAGGTYIPVFPIFTQLELDMEIPEDNIEINSIRVKPQALVGGAVKDVAVCGDATGHMKGYAGGEVVFETFIAGDATTNQILTLNVKDSKTMQMGDKLRASVFFFPCGDTDKTSQLAEERTNVDFKIQVIVDYKQNGEEKHSRVILDKVPVFLQGVNNVNLGKIGGNGTASTKKFTFS